MIGQRDKLLVDIAEFERHQRAFVEKPHDMVQDNREIREIANTPAGRHEAPERRPDWRPEAMQTGSTCRSRYTRCCTGPTR